MKLIFGYVAFLLVMGYCLPFIRNGNTARVIGWTTALVTLFFSTWVSIHATPIQRMIIVVSLQLISMKVLVMVEYYSGGNKLTLIQWVAFCLGWFGMRPTLFEKFPGPPLSSAPLLLKGISRIAIGVVLLYLSRYCDEEFHLKRFFLPQLLLLAGLSFILHLGILNVSAAIWRSVGVPVQELFQSPYKALSLKEFWGRRWNIAYSEMTSVISYRPLRPRVGAQKALLISFLLSGLLHEIAISLPVMSGFGLPMVYFIIQAIAMQLESRAEFVRNMLKTTWVAHVWVMALLMVPLPLLFHGKFITEVLKLLRDIVSAPAI